MTVYDVTIESDETLKKVYIAAESIYSAFEFLKCNFPEDNVIAIIAFEGEFYIALEDNVE